MFGLLNINKPSGLTSRDVVNHVQRIVRPVKVGHAGTLDPLADGVLILTVGPATRLTQYVQRMQKAYRATFLLGKTSDTEDVLGNVTEITQAVIPTRSDIEVAIPGFIGDILQRPPAYSALKVKGKRAYQRARDGEQFVLEPRPIRIDQIVIVSYRYPELTLDIHCGSGTYVRSLGRDLAESMGTAAVMSGLTRTAIGHFELATAIGLQEITLEALPQQLTPPIEAVRELPHVRLDALDQRRLETGRAVGCGGFDSDELAAINDDGDLLAILQRRGADQYGPVRNFSARQDGS